MPAMHGLQALAHGAVLSSFTRTARLLDGIEPGHKKTIEMTAGDPKEAMPAFVADKLVEAKAAARHLSQDPRLRRAAQGDRRLDRPPLRPCRRDRLRRARCSPSTARAKACSSRRCRRSAARASAAAGPSCCSPIRSIRPTSAAPTAPAASRSISTPRPRPGICPISTRWSASPTSCGAPRPSILCSPANPQGSVAGARLLCARRWRWRASTISCCSSTSATRRSTRREAPTGGLRDRGRDARALQEPHRLQLAVQALEPARHALRLRRRRRRFPRHAGRDPQPDRAADAGARPACLGRGLVGGAARRASSARPTAPSSTSATSCWPAASAIAGPAGGFFLWLDMSQLGGGEQATLTIWKRCGVKVIPGVYLAHEDRHGVQSGPRLHSRRARARCGDRQGSARAYRRVISVTVPWCMAYRGDDPALLLPASLKDRLQGWLWKVLGFLLLAACAALSASLLTWSAADPSLTHATSGAARNLLGPPGAILSDLLMQMLGLAGVFVLLPPLFWALQLLTASSLPDCAASSCWRRSPFSSWPARSPRCLRPRPGRCTTDTAACSAISASACWRACSPTSMPTLRRRGRAVLLSPPG